MPYRVLCIVMPDVDAMARRNADAPWNMFSPEDYWRRNYSKLHPEDREIIHHVRDFFASALAGRPRVQRAIDVGAGTNLYPALLMLPWTKQILLTDFSKSNVEWLHDELRGDNSAWLRFWREMQKKKEYSKLAAPLAQLREACANDPGLAGIEQLSVFDLPKARWNLGTMFFVAESITADPREFRDAVTAFVAALKPGSPFATAFMAGSNGYPVDGTDFPALPIKRADVWEHLDDLHVHDLKVTPLETSHRVRDGYAGMIVATGFASSAGIRRREN
jgi:NNMT/PNMT/TEMT family